MTTPAQMYEYHVWATRTVLARLRELPPAVYRQEIPNSSFRTAAEAMAHIYQVDYCWLRVLEGESMRDALVLTAPMREQAESAGIGELETLFLDLAGRYRDWFGRQDDLERTIVLDNPYTRIRETKLSEIVLQVVNHGTYHRGNLATMLRQIGHTSTMSEYVLYWYQEPETSTSSPEDRTAPQSQSDTAQTIPASAV